MRRFATLMATPSVSVAVRRGARAAMVGAHTRGRFLVTSSSAGPMHFPAAQLLAEAYGITDTDFAKIEGTGVRGTVTKSDVLAYASAAGLEVTPRPIPSPQLAPVPPRPAATSAVAADALPTAEPTPRFAYASRKPSVMLSAEEKFEDRPTAPAAAAAASALAATKLATPHVYLHDTCDVTALQDTAGDGDVVSLVALAAVRSLARMPALATPGMPTHVQLETVQGTTVVANAGACSARALQTAAQDAADRPADNVTPSLVVSLVGAETGVASQMPFVKPPAAVSVAVGAPQKEPVVGADGALGVADKVTVALSADASLVDVYDAQRYLDDIAKLVANPVLLHM